MGSPTSLLGSARAFARDFPRDAMPPGFLWDVVDFVPAIIDSNLTGRGKWLWGSAATGKGSIECGILAAFPNEDDLIVQTAGASGGDGPHAMRLNTAAVTPDLQTWTDLGLSFHGAQNPVMFRDAAVHCDTAAAVVPQLWRSGAVVNATAGMHRPRVSTVWQGALISGGGMGPAGTLPEWEVLRASIAGKDLDNAASFDTNAFIPTATKITGLATLRSMVLIFHPGSIERLRGGPLWNTAASIDGTGLVLDNLINGIGCKDPKTICNWQDNVVFADEHGVHMTDGAAVRDLTDQGGISYFWRLLYEGADSVVATTFLDYYIITVRHPPSRPPLPLVGVHNEMPGPVPLLTPPDFDGFRPPVPPRPDDLPPVRPPAPDPTPDSYKTTLVCDLNSKKWFRFSNVNAICFIRGGGLSGMERVWAGISSSDRLIRVGPTFYPDPTVEQIDDDGVVVKPRIETPWYRIGKEGRKRLRFGYLSYDVRGYAPIDLPVSIGYSITPQGDRGPADAITVPVYSEISRFPVTDQYTRYRFPINRAPYGIMFFIEAIQTSSLFRIFDLAIEGYAEEASRV